MSAESTETEVSGRGHSAHQVQLQGLPTPRAGTPGTLPMEPVTGSAIVQNRHSLASTSEVDSFSQSTSTGNNQVMPLSSAAAVAQPENHPTAVAIGPQPRHNSSDTSGRYTPCDSLVPSSTQMVMRRGAACTRTTFVHLGCGLRVIARVNIGHKELEYGPSRNTKNACHGNTPGYQTTRVLTVLERLRIMREEIRFRYKPEEQEIPNVSASNFVFPDLVPRGGTSQRRVGAQFIWCHTCQRAYRLKAGVGGAPAAAGVSALVGPEGGGLASAQGAVHADASQLQGGRGHCRCGASGDCHTCCHAQEEGTRGSASDMTNTNSNIVDEDSHLELDEAESEAPEDDTEGQRDDGRRATAVPEASERTVEERDPNFLRDGRQTDEEDSASDGYGHNADVESDSSSPLDEDAQLTVQMNKVTFQLRSVQRQFKQLIKHPTKKILAQLQLIFKTFTDRVDLSEFKRTETVEEKCEAVAAPRTSVAENSAVPVSICQEGNTDGSGVFCAPGQLEMRDYDADDECDMFI